MCVFCDIIAHKIPSKAVYEDDDVLAILDISQLQPGHTIVMPKKHVRNLAEADPETLQKTILAVQKVGKMVLENTDAVGFNVISNCGAAAGQSVDHLHFHVVPRHGKEDDFGFHEVQHPDTDLDAVLAKLKG